MADQEHLDILKQGVNVWNQWRKEHPEIQPDLSRAKLTGADLQSFNLGGTKLQDTALSFANLRGSDLRGSDLRHASLDRTDLTEANLTNCTLFFSNAGNADFSGAYCCGLSAECTGFQGAFFKGADLGYASFSQCNLEYTSFISANLQRASFYFGNYGGSRGSLKRADFRDANLSEADLREADLSEGNFTRTNLTKTVMIEANLERAVLKGTILRQVDLRYAKGLETIRHQGVSFVDERTVERCACTLPGIFLQGVGASESLIKYAQSLDSLSAASTPTRYYSCFISYASKDKLFAQQLHNDLENNGVHCWFAPEDLKIGDRYRERIKTSIYSYEKLILILSIDAVQSNWVETEVAAALEREKREDLLLLFPVQLDNAVMEATKSWAEDLRWQRHIGDFTQWMDEHAYRSAFERLLRDLTTEPLEEEA